MKIWQLFAFIFASVLATQTSAFEHNSSYNCPAVGASPAVGIWIGRIDPDDVEEIVSVALWPLGDFDGPSVGHAPFSVGALSECELAAPRFDWIDLNGFEDGYDLWSTAFKSNEAGVWTVTPSEAYGMMLGVLEQ